MIFDDATLRKLNTLTLVASQVRAGVMKGDRRSRKRGTSLEFADYRNYVPGDDLRRLDWNIYARLDKPFIKLFEEEEDLAVHLLVDASKSMDWGEGDENKFSYALRLAGALGVITLSGGDRLTASFLTPQGIAGQYGPARGNRHTLHLLAFLEKTRPAGQTDLNRSLYEFGVTARRPGLTILISDFYSPGGWQTGLKLLQSRGHELAVLHLLSPEEVDPPLAGDLRLIDTETGYAQDVSLDRHLLSLYRNRLAAWQSEIKGFCTSRSIHYLPIRTDTPWDQVVLFQLRRERIVQ